MLVFIPHPKDPLMGSWCEVDRVPRVNPSAVRAIWRARMKALHLEGGYPLRFSMENAARSTASMLGLTERTVRIFVNLERRKRQRAATGRDAGRGGTSGQPRGAGRDVGRPNATGGPLPIDQFIALYGRRRGKKLGPAANRYSVRTGGGVYSKPAVRANAVLSFIRHFRFKASKASTNWLTAHIKTSRRLTPARTPPANR